MTIHELAAERQRLWREGGNPAEIERVSRMLADAYEAKRQRDAQGVVTNDQILKRARIELELEQLISS